ncbi:MAG TPA: tetratricopeptide repeat protein, partial [Draconibacterium sp.]|nr:tetratricopeptide repeat protein [Draconibacterium sp.]
GKYTSPFEKAIAVDSNYAEAYAGLADVYLISTTTQSYPRPEGFVKAKENVLHALNLDPNLAEAHATLGIINRYEWKWEEARKELETALNLNPNNATIQTRYAGLMYILRNKEAYKIHTLKAAELNPISPPLILSKAIVYRMEGNFEKALEEYNRYIELYPEIYSIYWALWDLFRSTGEDQKAIEALQKAYSITSLTEKKFANSVPTIYKNKGMKGLEEFDKIVELYSDTYPEYYHLWHTYIAKGEEQKAVNLLQKAFFSASLLDKNFADSIPEIYKNIGMKGLEQKIYEHNILTDKAGSWKGLARYCIETGDKEQALDWLEKAYEWEIPRLPGINGDPDFDPIRNEPRFQALLDKMGLTKYQ